jgi:predicted nuclease of predicted toxin-antitoxin system
VRTFWQFTHTLPNWQQSTRSRQDEASLRRKPFAEACGYAAGSFPGSESALRNGLSGQGDLKILEYASTGGFVLVSTDSDFEHLTSKVEEANVVLRSCNYPTKTAEGVLRRNAIRITELSKSRDRLLVLDR